jgi:phage terminase small subunit
MALTPKQERFVEEYLRDLNATKAAIRAGYAPRAAQEQSSRLLSNAMVADAVARAKAERAARAGIDADRVLEEIKALALANLSDFASWGPGRFELHESGEVDTRAVQAVTIKEVTISNDHGEITKVEQGIKLHDKLGALEKLCRHLGIAVDRKDMTISNKDGETFNVEVRPVDYRKALGAFMPPADDEDES